MLKDNIWTEKKLGSQIWKHWADLLKGCVYLYTVFQNFFFSVLTSENKDAGKLWKTYSEGLFQFVLYFIAL